MKPLHQKPPPKGNNSGSLLARGLRYESPVSGAVATLQLGDSVSLIRRTATAGSDVVQSGRPIFDDFSNICGRISAITRRMLSSKWSSVCGLSA
ncbi:hypothetical protein TNCV_559581 [Trichonephila clavipes]|nr:hypothetical protein TNCV_559581 [Trichonephila clavipes]